MHTIFRWLLDRVMPACVLCGRRSFLRRHWSFGAPWLVKVFSRTASRFTFTTCWRCETPSLLGDEEDRGERLQRATDALLLGQPLPEGEPERTKELRHRARACLAVLGESPGSNLNVYYDGKCVVMGLDFPPGTQAKMVKVLPNGQARLEFRFPPDTAGYFDNTLRKAGDRLTVEIGRHRRS